MTEAELELIIEKRVRKRIMLYALIAAAFVCIFALLCFVGVKIMYTTHNEYVPIIQVIDDDKWAIIREFDNWDVDVNIDSFEHHYNKETGQYDVILHYNPREEK